MKLPFWKHMVLLENQLHSPTQAYMFLDMDLPNE